MSDTEMLGTRREYPAHVCSSAHHIGDIVLVGWVPKRDPGDELEQEVCKMGIPVRAYSQAN
jgi:hypothetical protein